MLECWRGLRRNRIAWRMAVSVTATCCLQPPRRRAADAAATRWLGLCCGIDVAARGRHEAVQRQRAAAVRGEQRVDLVVQPVRCTLTRQWPVIPGVRGRVGRSNHGSCGAVDGRRLCGGHRVGCARRIGAAREEERRPARPEEHRGLPATARGPRVRTGVQLPRSGVDCGGVGGASPPI